MEKQKEKMILRKIAQVWRPQANITDVLLEVTAFCQQQDIDVTNTEIRQMVQEAAGTLKARMA